MKRLYISILLISLVYFDAVSQVKTYTMSEIAVPTAKANYQLASRFSPNKVKKMVYSTSVDPHWLKLSNRFWYEYETPNGKEWYLVDPLAKSKRKIFSSFFH